LDPINLKKVFTIAMLFVILFNLGGYSLFFQYMIDRSDNKIIDRINNNHYHSSDLVEVKIPVSLPTLQDWTEFETISGQVQFKNNKYNYAQIKMTRDTLYLLIIPNHNRTKLFNANIIYAKQVNDIPVNKKSHNSLAKKSISENEYNYTILQYNALPSAENIKTSCDYAFSDIIETSILVPGQPPEFSNFLS
jgi:hypothetical protein